MGQSGALNDAAEASRRDVVKVERARDADAALNDASARAANIQSLAMKLRVELGLNKQATAKALSLAQSLNGGGGPIGDLLQPFAFSLNPEETYLPLSSTPSLLRELRASTAALQRQRSATRRSPRFLRRDMRQSGQ